METCPDKDCHEAIALHLKSKVSWKALVPIVAIIITLAAAGLNAWGNAKDERKENKQAVALLGAHLDNIERAINKIEQRQIDPAALIKEIERLIRQNVQGGFWYKGALE